MSAADLAPWSLAAHPARQHLAAHRLAQARPHQPPALAPRPDAAARATLAATAHARDRPGRV